MCIRDSESTARRGCGHYAPALGALLAACRLTLDDAQRLFLFTGTRGVCAAAVRLGIVGPYRAQRLQHECLESIDDVIRRCGALSVDECAQTAPLVDLLQSTHDRLYSRLFQS